MYANAYIQQRRLFISAYYRKCLPSYHSAIKVGRLWGGDPSCVLMALLSVGVCALAYVRSFSVAKGMSVCVPFVPV